MNGYGVFWPHTESFLSVPVGEHCPMSIVAAGGRGWLEAVRANRGRAWVAIRRWLHKRCFAR